jgi:hypothetical protein
MNNARGWGGLGMGMGWIVSSQWRGTALGHTCVYARVATLYWAPDYAGLPTLLVWPRPFPRLLSKRPGNLSKPVCLGNRRHVGAGGGRRPPDGEVVGGGSYTGGCRQTPRHAASSKMSVPQN